jgi:uncharacterized protein YceH (UPF0502 family)
LSLNAITNGANQKNNRDPVIEMDEDRAFTAVEGLRGKGLAVRVDQAGSRVSKYKHAAGEKLNCRPGEIAILAELMLRGPQTVGEIRGRASRMQPLESLEVVRGLLNALMERGEPLVKELPGGRADRFTQLLAPDAHPITAPSDEPTITTARESGLAERVQKLEAEVQTLRAAIRRLATQVGEPDPLAAS